MLHGYLIVVFLSTVLFQQMGCSMVVVVAVMAMMLMLLDGKWVLLLLIFSSRLVRKRSDSMHSTPWQSQSL